jgi:hypothetical protein
MKSFAYSINIYAMGLKVKFFLVKRMSIVARGVGPVLTLPIADLAILAHGINPVVPCLAARGDVSLAKAFALLDHRKDLSGEGFACVCEKDDGRNV